MRAVKTDKDAAKVRKRKATHHQGSRQGAHSPAQYSYGMHADEDDNAGGQSDNGGEISHESLVVEGVWVLPFYNGLPHYIRKVNG
mmetsp:Transcript_18619/g.44816  ORF Transcript_18619/g.44816 Transcript_18619/m.44816 type:complete len:85 (+) Transcript_18619:1088-1342(+)